LGPNVSGAGGSRVRRSRLRDCIVGEHTEIESCDLHASIVGDHARLRGVRGSVSVGDHSVVDGSAS
ncbi:MAG: sugar phosphate nucleotidyltransferase, partial [Gemmatimonadota bacterium]